MNRPLPLYPDAQPCLRSGWCCKQGPCQFGEWDEAKHQCAYLGGDKPGEHFCMKAEEIMQMNPVLWHWSPAFGAGCCSSLNPDHQRLKRLQK